MVSHYIEDGYLNDESDLDAKILVRPHVKQTPSNIERYKYVPFQSPHFEIIIGPTRVEPVFSVKGIDEDDDDDEISDPAPPEPSLGFYDRLYAESDERWRQEVRFVKVLIDTYRRYTSGGTFSTRGRRQMRTQGRYLKALILISFTRTTP